VWDGHMKMKSIKGSKGGGCSDHGRGGATISVGNVASRVVGRVVADHVAR